MRAVTAVNLRRSRYPGDYGYSGYGLVAYPGLYRSWGGELGLRYFFFDKETDIRLFRTIRPYVSISGGAAHVDHIGDVVYSGYYSRYYQAVYQRAPVR